jgi:hypothetical protein
LDPENVDILTKGIGMVEITDEQLAQALRNIEEPLKKYLWLQERVGKLAHPEDDHEFCRKFSGF